MREYGIAPEAIVKLASNENPFGCSLHVKDAVSKIVSKMARYPDDSMFRLKAGLAKHYGVKESSVIIGSGSDQVIEFAVHAKANKERRITSYNVCYTKLLRLNW